MKEWCCEFRLLGVFSYSFFRVLLRGLYLIQIHQQYGDEFTNYQAFSSSILNNRQFREKHFETNYD